MRLNIKLTQGWVLPPEEPEKVDYITDFVDVRDEKGMGLTYDFKNNAYL